MREHPAGGLDAETIPVTLPCGGGHYRDGVQRGNRVPRLGRQEAGGGDPSARHRLNAGPLRAPETVPRNLERGAEVSP